MKKQSTMNTTTSPLPQHICKNSAKPQFKGKSNVQFTITLPVSDWETLQAFGENGLTWRQLAQNAIRQAAAQLRAEQVSCEK